MWELLVLLRNFEGFFKITFRIEQNKNHLVSSLSCISKSPRELHQGKIPDIHPNFTNQKSQSSGKISKFQGLESVSSMNSIWDSLIYSVTPHFTNEEMGAPRG